MKRILLIVSVIFVSVISFSQPALSNSASLLTTVVKKSVTSDQTITIAQGGHKTGTISANDGDGVINILSIAASYQASLVSVSSDSSDPSNPLKFKITGVAPGNSTVIITWKNSANVQMTYTTTVTVTPPPPVTSITVTYL